MNAVVVFCNALTPCSFVLGRLCPKILAISLDRNQACTCTKGKWKPENCQLFQLGTALDFQKVQC
jgi:hypothetical protein